MAAEIVMPVIVRIGETEAQWGTITFATEDQPLTEDAIRRETLAFFREAIHQMENPDDEGEVRDAAP